jgi:hypothetical protein
MVRSDHHSWSSSHFLSRTDPAMLQRKLLTNTTVVAAVMALFTVLAAPHKW